MSQSPLHLRPLSQEVQFDVGDYTIVRELSSPKRGKLVHPTILPEALSEPTAFIVRSPPLEHSSTAASQSPPSPHTQAKTNIKVLNPVQSSKVRRPQNEPLRSPSTDIDRSPPVSTDRPVPPERVSGLSFDSEETTREVETQGGRCWQLLWMACSVLFITMVFPIGMFLLPATVRGGHNTTSTSSTTTTTTSAITQPPRVTYDAEENLLLPEGTTVAEFCSQRLASDNRLVPTRHLRTMPRFQPTGHDLQHRYLFCHFDAKYSRTVETYPPSQLPHTLCTAVVVAGYAIDVETRSPVWKHSSGQEYLREFAAMRMAGRLNHTSGPLAIYITVGGERVDSANFSAIVNYTMIRNEFVTNVGNLNLPLFLFSGRDDNVTHDTLDAAAWVPKVVRTEKRKQPKLYITGIHLDWNYPGDPCAHQVPNGGEGLRHLATELASQVVGVVVSVPAIAARANLYQLELLAAAVDYVFVKTHEVRAHGLVSCSGAQAFVSGVFNAIRSPLNRTLWPKIGYSISVGPETFRAKVAQLGAPSSGPSRWENYTLQPSRTHYAAVCGLPVINTPSHPECLMTERYVGQYDVEVATFADPAALQRRLKKAYADDMGMAPVMVYDVDLDDFSGRCGAGMSPLIQAIATTSF